MRRQRQEHRPDCLDLLCLSTCFVTMQYGGEGSRPVVHGVLVFETLWHQVAYECLMQNSTVSIVAQRETTEQRKHLAGLFLCATYKLSCISPSFPFHTSNPWQGCARDDLLFAEKSLNIRRLRLALCWSSVRPCW